MLFKPLIYCVLFLHLAAALSSLSQKVSLIAQSGIDDYAFENDIRDFLERIRYILKNGDPANDIPPMEPLPLDLFDFDFILEDSRLRGYLDKMLVHNLSDFIVTDVQFNVVGFKLTLELSWNILTIDGKYQLFGNVFEDAVDGQGDFQTQTTGFDLKVMVHIGSNLIGSHIKELTLDFSFLDDKITFTNNLDESNHEWDNDYAQPLLYRIRNEYFPLLLNTLTLVGSDLIHDLSLDEILKIILNIIQGQGLELIKSEMKPNH